MLSGKAPMNWDSWSCAVAIHPFGSAPCSTSRAISSKPRSRLWSVKPNDFPEMAAKKSKAPPKSSAKSVLAKLGIASTNPGVFEGEWSGSGKLLESISPVDGKLLAKVRTATPAEYDRVLERAQAAFKTWQQVPAPKRGE